jgi:hypothetical protein
VRGLLAWAFARAARFSPGYHILGFQPALQTATHSTGSNVERPFCPGRSFMPSQSRQVQSLGLGKKPSRLPARRVYTDSEHLGHNKMLRPGSACRLVMSMAAKRFALAACLLLGLGAAVQTANFVIK